MKYTLPFLLLYVLVLFGCSSEGSYEYRNPDKLDWVYRVYTYQEKFRPGSWSSFNYKGSLSSGLEKYLASIDQKEFEAYIHESKSDSLYQDWGIYEQNGEQEDTLFHARISPVLSRIGDYGKEAWLISSVKCSWKKSWKLRAFDIKPFVGLSYYSSLYGPGHEDNDITSHMILEIKIDDSDFWNHLSYGFRGDMDFRSAKEGWTIHKNEYNLFIPEGKNQENFEKLFEESWQTRARGNIFPELSY